MNMIRHLRTPLDLPIALFLASGLIGVWASYDTAASWPKFAMIVAAVVLYYVLVALRSAPQFIETFVWLFLFGCCALTLYFVTQHDYAAQPGKFGFITAIGLALNRIAPQLGRHVFDPNITSGALEIGLPLAIALCASQKRSLLQTTGVVMKSKSKDLVPVSLAFVVAMLVSLLIAFGLVMTSSRGAWLALGIVACISVLGLIAKDMLRRYALPIGVIVVLSGVITLLLLRDAFVPTLESILGTIPAGDTAVSRVELWRQAWGLIQDYCFTGSGLGVFPMILSTYALLIDVPFLTHVHNLFVQIWLEQGVLGFVAFLWLVIAFYLWAWNRRNALSWLAWGGIAASTVMLLHGLVDVLLYSSRALPLLLLPFGVAVSSGQMAENRTLGAERETEARNQDLGPAKLKPRRWNLGLGLVALAIFGVLLSSFIFHPSSFVALWYANLGSVAQTKAELNDYHWPDRLVGDVRRGCLPPAGSCRLNKAEEYFRDALAFDPGNVTANQRLATIALTLGSFGDAQEFLGRAYRRDPQNGVTGRLLGLVSKR